MARSLTSEQVIGGRYALEELIGSGGMGEVWRARHTSLQSHVAIKFLTGGQSSRETTTKRFLTEAQVTAQLRSQNAVQVYDFGVEDGQPYIVMELLTGETLADRIIRGPLDRQDACEILKQASRALDRAHALGIIHRDFKPDNVVLTRDEEGKQIAKVLDFGIAKLVGQLESDSEDDEEPTLVRKRPLTSFTRTGTICGTPQYMSPEQARSALEYGPATDVWALGVVAFECLAGCPPFDGEDLTALLDAITHGKHLVGSRVNPELPPAFDEWFATACQHDPANRFQSAGDAVTALRVALDAGMATSSEVPAASGALSYERHVIALEAGSEGNIELDIAPAPASRTMGPPASPRALTSPTSPPQGFTGPTTLPEMPVTTAAPRMRAPRPVVSQAPAAGGRAWVWMVGGAVALFVALAVVLFARR